MMRVDGKRMKRTMRAFGLISSGFRDSVIVAELRGTQLRKKRKSEDETAERRRTSAPSERANEAGQKSCRGSWPGRPDTKVSEVTPIHIC